MSQLSSLSPRYRLDEHSRWLEGIDPVRHYWILVNGDANVKVPVPGVMVSSLSDWKLAMRQFRALQPGDAMTVERVADACTIHCIRNNCYALACSIEDAPVWHLFDEETLENLLRTAHPDWQCTPNDIDLGRELLNRCLRRSTLTSSFY